MITNEVIIDSIATGQNIKKLMKLHNHSVAHLSKLSGLSPTTITNYRSGYNVPNLHNLCVLASIYGVQISDIIVSNHSLFYPTFRYLYSWRISILCSFIPLIVSSFTIYLFILFTCSMF